MIGSQPRTHPPIPCPSRRTTVRPACTWCTLAQDAALALDAAECTWNMVRPCTIIYLPTYLLIIETKHNLHARKKHCLSLSIYIHLCSRYDQLFRQGSCAMLPSSSSWRLRNEASDRCRPRAARRGPTTMTSPCAVAGKVAILGPGGAKGVANIWCCFYAEKKGESIFLEIDWGEIFWWSPTANPSFWCGGPLDHVWCQDGHWGSAMSWTIWEGSSRCTLMAHPNSGWRSPWCRCRARRLVKAVGSVLRIF